jgi:hypothetical protein
MNRQFIFKRSATDSAVVPVESFSHAEYGSDTTVKLYFDAKRSGKDATIEVILTVTSGKAHEVLSQVTNQVAVSNVSVVIYDAVVGNYQSSEVTGIDSITVTEGPAQLVPSGGDTGEVLTKDSATDYDVSWQDVHTLYVEVRNQSGGTLSKGTPVHATGATGNVADVIAARADTASAMPATYVLNEEIADGANGQAIISGTISGVDTSSFSPGDVIYVGETGGFVNVKPTGTNLIQNLGVVTKSNANNGSGVVLGAGRSNDVPNIADGYAWIGNASGVATATQLATVATTGSYDDLSDQPTIPADTHLGNTDLTLSGNRVLEMGSNSLDLQSSSASKFKIFNTGTAQGTGRFTVNGNGTAAGILRVSDASSSNIIGIQHPDSGSGYTLKLPIADGSANQVLSTDGSGNLSFDGSTKTYGSITCGFFDDISTLAHYLPLNGPPTEINSDNNSYTDWLCPCDIIVKSAQLSFSGFSGSGNLTMTIEKDAIGSATSTTVESETVAISGAGDNYDVVHFLFDNAPVSAGERLKIKIQADADITGNSNVFAQVVYEADWSTRFTQSSGIITS